LKLKELTLFKCLNCDNSSSSFSDSNYFFKTAAEAAAAAAATAASVVAKRTSPARLMSGDAPNDRSMTTYATIDSRVVMNATKAASTTQHRQHLLANNAGLDTSTTSSVSFLSATSSSVESHKSSDVSLSPVSRPGSIMPPNNASSAAAAAAARSAFSFTNSSHFEISHIYDNTQVKTSSPSLAANAEFKNSVFRDASQGSNLNKQFVAEEVNELVIVFLFLSYFDLI
jgi:hypothetical protein